MPSSTHCSSWKLKLQDVSCNTTHELTALPRFEGKSFTWYQPMPTSQDFPGPFARYFWCTQLARFFELSPSSPDTLGA